MNVSWLALLSAKNVTLCVSVSVSCTSCFIVVVTCPVCVMFSFVQLCSPGISSVPHLPVLYLVLSQFVICNPATRLRLSVGVLSCLLTQRHDSR